MEDFEVGTKSPFDGILSQQKNLVCFECGEEQPQWASVNNGIIICLDCCGTHRSLGADISLCRSMKLGMWTDKQLSMLESGGNQKLQDFCDKYKLMDVDIQYRYNTKALIHYRKRIDCLVIGSPFDDEEPNFDDGRTLADGRKLDNETNLPDSTIKEDLNNLLQLDARAPLSPLDTETLRAKGAESVMKKFKLGFADLRQKAKDSHAKI